MINIGDGSIPKIYKKFLCHFKQFIEILQTFISVQAQNNSYNFFSKLTML